MRKKCLRVGQNRITHFETRTPDLAPHTLSLSTRAAGEDEDGVRWDTRPLEELVGHIVEHYHTPLKTEIPRLIDLARQVEQAHADKADRPAGLADLLVQIRKAVE